jgi:phosphoribosylamine--glycine ligase
MASPGYPEAPRTGGTIRGLTASGQSTVSVEGVTVFHAGTSRPDQAGPFTTAGGRVLAVTAVAPTLGGARANAYAALEPISWDGVLVRRDIAAGVATADNREELVP